MNEQNGMGAMTTAPFGWNYDPEHDVCWQTGIVYCGSPCAPKYHSLGIFVPGKYMNTAPRADGGCECTVRSGAQMNGYTAETAPIVIPLDTPGYAASPAPTGYDYERIAEFVSAGFIYVHAGCRGRESGVNDDQTPYCGGAPWGVTDLKAAVRWLRYNAEYLPGDTDMIFTFGHSGGGAQSSLMGATGDSELYRRYLESIGAAMTDKNGEYISDAVCGSMCWCPITTLGYAGAAYEWMIGQHFSEDTRARDKWTSALSDDLAQSFAEYRNGLGLNSPDGRELALVSSENGIFCAGSYYDYLLEIIGESLSNYLNDNFDDDEARLAYIDSLNDVCDWAEYDADSQRAKVKSIGEFVRRCKYPFKRVGAFDDLSYDQIENVLFGTTEKQRLHFDAVMAGLIAENADRYAGFADFNAGCAEDCRKDLDYIDALGSTIAERRDMYDPLYFLCRSKGGYGTSRPARFWRINTGIEQGDTSLTTEVDLALALRCCPAVERVDFTTVWKVGHTFAERTGGCMANFIAWVDDCCKN